MHSFTQKSSTRSPIHLYINNIGSHMMLICLLLCSEVNVNLVESSLCCIACVYLEGTVTVLTLHDKYNNYVHFTYLAANFCWIL